MKSIFKKVTLLVLMFGLVFALFGCKKNDAKALENYLLKQDSKVVDADFVLDGTLNFNDKDYELSWSSNNNAIQLEKRDKDYLAKINYPDQETVVTLTVKLGKATKEFTVTVQPIDVYKFSDTYVFPKDKQIVTESFDLDASCSYVGKSATIAWSVDEAYADYIAISEDGARCLVFPSSVDTEVKIKGTFTYNNETTTKQYRMTVSKTKTAEEQVDYWYSNTGISQVISGYVVAKGNWKEYNGVYEAIICVLDDSGLCGYYLYLEPTDINKEAFEAMPLGTHVTNTGSVNTNYNGLQETTNYKGKTVLDNDIEVKQIVPFAIDNDLIAGGPVATYMTSTLVSLTNWEVKEVKEWSVSGSTNTILIVTKGGVDVPIVTSKYFLIEPDSLSTDTTVIPAIQQSVKDLKAGDFVNIKGILSNYKGPQIVANSADSITMGVADTTAAADLPGSLVKALMAVNKEKAPKGLVTSNTVIEMAASTDKVTVKYELLGSSNSVSIEGNNLTINPGKKENSTVKVTYTCGEWSTYELIKISAEKVSAQEMLDAEKAKITNFNVDKTTELASKGETYSEVVITWALKEPIEGVAIEAGKLVVGGGLNKDVVLVATLTLGEASETKEVTVHVTTPDLGHNGTPTDPLDAKTAITMAGQLDGPSKEMSAFAYFVKATIVDDPTAEYCNFHFASGEDQIVVYGLWAANGTDRYGSKREIAELPVKKGDEVVVYAKLQNFQGTLELANAILVSVNGVETGAQIKLTAREAVLIASELDGDAKEKTEGRFLFEVTITDDPTAEYCNFHFASGDKEVLVYGLYNNDGTKRYGSKRDIAELPVKKGDKVVLEAKVQNFQGTYQLADAWLISIDKPIVIEHAGTEADPFTVSDAITKTEQETGKKDNTFTAAKYYVTGVVKSVKYYDIKDSNGTVIGKDATIELQEGSKVVKASYTLTPESLDTIYVGDTVTIYGFLQYYSGSSSLYPKDKNNSETGEWPTAVAVVHGNGSVAVATDSSEHATVKDLSAQTGVNGTTFTFKVEVAENFELDFVKVNGKEVEAVDGVYTVTFNGAMTILVGTVEATATERTIEIDFAQTIEGAPQSKSARHSASSVEVTIGGITFDLRNVYQSAYNGEAYMMLASATTDADADSAGEKVAKAAAWIANKTPIPGRIKSITVYGRDGSSTTCVYYLDAFDAAKIEALASSTTTVTGLTTNTLVYTAAEDANLYYFNLTTTTAKNGQITKIVIVYEPGDVPQPAPTLTGVKVGGTDVNLTLNAQTGEYEGTFSLSRQWARVNFVKVYSDASEVKLMPADTTITGTGILNKLLTNSTDTEVLFYDSGVELGDFCYSLASETKYAVKYNPTTNTLTVDVATEEVPTTVKAVKYGGAKQGSFELKDGKYEAVVELGAWNRIKFSVVDANDKEIALWYTNATFTGLFTAADKTGDQWGGELYHETGDSLRWMPGAAETYKLVYDPATKTMNAEKYVPQATLTGVSVTGAVNVALVKNAETGIYEGTFALGTLWNTVQFKAIYSDESQVALTAATTTIAGNAINPAKVGGAPYSVLLFADTDDMIAAGSFCYSLSTETTYSVSYNPEAKLLVVDLALPTVPAEVKAVKFGGAKSGEFAKQQDGTFVAYVQLGAWNRISFALVDASDQEIALWYSNAEFAGAITAANKFGDQWAGDLYHETADGARWMPPAAGAWKFVYDPATKTMTVAKYTDQTAPVITVSNEVLSALAAHDFVEGENASALFGQLLAGISANDELDGAITVTQEMVNLGGLNPASLVKGDYTITITVADAAGNAGTKQLKLHVRGEHADEDLLADLPNAKADYKSANWTYDKYTTDWVNVTGVQMRCREKKDANQQTVWTTNMACGYSTTYRYKYSTGKSLGIANTLSLQYANDFDGAQAIKVKVILIDVNGNQVYALGAAGNDGYVTVAAGTALTPIELTFTDTEVKEIRFVLLSANGNGAYFYVGDAHLSYEAPAPSPSAGN